MLIMVMHNNKEYLKELKKIAQKVKLRDHLIVKKEGLGTLLKGATADVIFSGGSKTNIYKKSFLIVVRDQEKASFFLEVLKRDNYLNRINQNQEGFIAIIPFECLNRLQN